MAEIIYEDGQRKFLEPPKGETAIRAPTGWEKARMVGSGALEKIGVPQEGAKNISEFVIPGSPAEAGMQVGLMAMPGVGQAAKLAPKVLEKSPIARSLVQRGIRSALPAVGGAVGAASGDQPVAPAAGKGLMLGAGGEATSAVVENIVRGVGRSTGTNRVERLDAARLGAAISDAVKEFGQPKTTEDIYQLAVRSHGKTALDQARDTALEEISTGMKNRQASIGRSRLVKEGTGRTQPPVSPAPVDVATGKAAQRPPFVGPPPPPPPTGGMGTPTGAPPVRSVGTDAIAVPSLQQEAGQSLFTLKEATGWLTRLGDEGWLMSRKLKEGLPALDARGLRQQARNEIIAALEKEMPGAGTKFDQAQKHYSKGLTILEVLNKPGVIADGRLNINALRDVLKSPANQRETFSQQMERRLTPDDVSRFYRSIFRGGPQSARDVEGSLGLHGTLGAAGHPHIRISRPHLPKFSGAPEELPKSVRPGSFSGFSRSGIPQMTFGMLGLGLTTESTDATTGQ